MVKRIEVSVRCIDDYDETIYGYEAEYSSEGNTQIVQSEADDYTKALASDALYMTQTLLRNQIKTELSDKETVIKEI